MEKHIPEINQVHLMDCLDFLKSLPDDFVDLVVTSPPYALKRKDVYGGISEKEYPDWLFSVSVEIMRTLKPTGSLVMNIKEGCNNGCRQQYVLEYQLMMVKAYRWVETFIWHKTNPFPTGNKKRLKDGYEYCFQFCKTPDYKFFPDNCLQKSESIWQPLQKKRKNQGAFLMTNGSELHMSKRIDSEYVRPSNVITFASSCLNIDHPAVFPLNLPEFFIKLMTEEGDLVCDPLMGSGTTAIAACRLKRNFIGSESKFEYVQLTNKRLNTQV